MEDFLREFYKFVFPCDILCQWLHHHQPYWSHREFCFTSLSNNFSRFLSFASSESLRLALIQRVPGKVDVGAVYRHVPMKGSPVPNIPVERELVFDLDLTDYDPIRVCCGASAGQCESQRFVCPACWQWMSCAVHILLDILREDMGLVHSLIVFSGRRGVHLWICDPSALTMTNAMRDALVSYMTVINGAYSINIMAECRQQQRLHPTLERIYVRYIPQTFQRLFLNPRVRVTNREDVQEIENPNCIFVSPAAALMMYKALLKLDDDWWGGRNRQQHLSAAIRTSSARVTLSNFKEGDLFSNSVWEQLMRTFHPGFIKALHLSLVYPRLDVHVSKRMDHLLKLPLCIHPNTRKLCVPLTVESIDEFNPEVDPPLLENLVTPGSMEGRWLAPIVTLIQDVALAREERERGKLDESLESVPFVPSMHLKSVSK